MNILGAAVGTALSIPIVYIWGLQGIPAYMVLTAAVGALISWSYARRDPNRTRQRFLFARSQLKRQAS